MLSSSSWSTAPLPSLPSSTAIIKPPPVKPSSLIVPAVVKPKPSTPASATLDLRSSFLPLLPTLPLTLGPLIVGY